ncbi:MAG: lysylphosphatidylglycerol synthase transmembrane domain-containing protein [Thermoleophilia bacterium]|nr:lysylphosphatidylglycerol synthase transmembrane domain-containing protein [Thermoleophilia bacterium]
MPEHLRRNLLIGVACSVALYFALGLYADFDELLQAFQGFTWYLLPVALACTLVNYLVRFVKWEYLIRVIDIRIPVVPSFVIFISGLTMTISPAKMGEVMKSFLLKDYGDVPVSHSSPVVVAERATDVMGIVILGSAGSLAYAFGRELMAVTVVMMTLFIILVQTRSLCLRLIKLAERIPFIRRFAEHFEKFYESAYVLLKVRRLLPSVVLSTIGWFFECLAAYICLRGLGVDLSLMLVTFIFVFASLAGALSMIPGGLGVAEGSMTGLMVSNGVDRGDAVAGTILIRLVTFWFAILLGLIGISLYGTLARKKENGWT